jgi:hypothetical protein
MGYSLGDTAEGAATIYFFFQRQTQYIITAPVIGRVCVRDAYSAYPRPNALKVSKVAPRFRSNETVSSARDRRERPRSAALSYGTAPV